MQREILRDDAAVILSRIDGTKFESGRIEHSLRRLVGTNQGRREIIKRQMEGFTSSCFVVIILNRLKHDESTGNNLKRFT